MAANQQKQSGSSNRGSASMDEAQQNRQRASAGKGDEASHRQTAQHQQAASDQGASQQQGGGQSEPDSDQRGEIHGQPPESNR